MDRKQAAVVVSGMAVALLLSAGRAEAKTIELRNDTLADNAEANAVCGFAVGEKFAALCAALAVITAAFTGALLAAKVGATYVSPFVGRLDAVGHDGMELVRQIKTIYRNYGFATQIITAAARHPLHVLQAALAGSDVMTMGFDILQQLYQHPLTDSVLDQFLKDWAKIPAK